MNTTVTVRLMHASSIPGAFWCEPVGWEPKNQLEGAEFVDGSWWNADSEEAGLVWFGVRGEEDEVEVEISCLRVASCGECRVIGGVIV